MDAAKNVTFLEKEYIVRVNQICDIAREKHEDWESTVEDVYSTITNLVNFVVDNQIKSWIDDVFHVNNVKSSWVMKELKNYEISNLYITNLQKLVKFAVLQKFALSNSSKTSKNRSLIYNVYTERVHNLTYGGVSRDTIRSSHAVVMKDMKRVIQNILENINSLSNVYNTPLDIWMVNTEEGMKNLNEFVKSKSNDFNLEIHHSLSGGSKYDGLSKLPPRIGELYNAGKECYIDVYIWMYFKESVEKYGFSEDYSHDVRYKRLMDRYSFGNKDHRLFVDSVDIEKHLSISKKALTTIMGSVIEMIDEK